MTEESGFVPENPAIVEAVGKIKKRLGSRLLILAHHFQRPDVLAGADKCGGSFELAKLAAESDAEWIVFCGANFMAQSASVLARPDQTVFHPNPDAGCPMVQMVNRDDMARAFSEISRVRRDQEVVPIAYMNTFSDVQAFVGEHGGTISTSSNEQEVMRWACAKSDSLFFVPDEHVGRGMAWRFGLSDDRVVVYNPRRGKLGGLSRSALEDARLVLWPGYCPTHSFFSVEHIESARRRWPACKVFVHSECRAEVAERADGVGSTSFLFRSVQEAPRDSMLVIGTEVNVVNRLAIEHPDKHILPLEDSDRAACPDMYRITSQNLLDTLEGLPDCRAVRVGSKEQAGARQALERMFRISKPRLLVSLQASFVPMDNSRHPLTGQTIDLSQQGLFFQADPLPVKTEGMLTIKLPHTRGNVEAVCAVGWTRPEMIGQAGKSNQPGGMGMEFKEISPECAARLYDFLETEAGDDSMNRTTRNPLVD